MGADSFMEALPIQYLHLETVVMPLFLAMIILVQLARTTEGTTYVISPRRQWGWLLASFILMAIMFSGLLFNVSLLLAGELAAGFTLALLHPVNALCFFVHLLFLRPWEIATTNPLLLALPRVVALLCLFSWLIYHTGRTSGSIRTTRGVLLLLAFSCWLFLSTFASPDVGASQSEWFRTYFKALVLFVMTVYFIDTRRSLSQFSLTLVISALTLMVVRFYQYHTEGPTLIRLEAGGMFGDPNDLAAVIIMALPFALVPAFKKGMPFFNKLVGFLFATFALCIMWYAQSRGAMLALTAQLLTAGIVLRTKKNWITTFLLFAILGGGFLMALRSIARDAQEMQESSDSRIMYWKAAINMTLHKPLLGVGFGEYASTYNAYSSGERYEWGRRTAHSSWFLVFAESGIPGGCLFVGFFLMVLWIAWQNRQIWPEQLLALIGYGVTMSFLSHTYLFYFYLLSGVILATESLKERT